jgi:O-antigen ligase
MVAPASIIPLVWLTLFWFIFYVIKKGTIPRESVPLLLFISVAIIASAVAFFLDIPPFKGQGISGEEISAILTLMIGATFYLVTASWLSNSHSRLTFTLKLISASGSIMLFWALVQAVYIFLFQGKYPDVLLVFQHFFSTRSLWYNRITSFAFEPSWLAHQLNLIFLPFWLAATITGWSAFRFRLWRISLENILLAIGVIVLFLSSSRIGTLSFLLVVAFLGIYFNIYLAKRLQKLSQQRLTLFPPLFQRVVRGILPVIILLAFSGVYVLGAVILVYGLSHVDWRLERFFQIKSLLQLKSLLGNVYALFNHLAFAERFVYWVAGWNVFNLHPLLGVGLGNAGFFFQRALPAYSWSLPEVMDTYYRASALPNIKSFWIRLLAETGIVGFSSFVAWFYVLFRSSWFIRLNKTPLFRMIGWGGLFVLIAFVLEGFSIDTFALPYLWVSLGIVSAVGALSRNSSTEDAADRLHHADAKR